MTMLSFAYESLNQIHSLQERGQKGEEEVVERSKGERWEGERRGSVGGMRQTEGRASESGLAEFAKYNTSNRESSSLSSAAG